MGGKQFVSEKEERKGKEGIEIWKVINQIDGNQYFENKRKGERYICEQNVQYVCT